LNEFVLTQILNFVYTWFSGIWVSIFIIHKQQRSGINKCHRFTD